MVLDILPAEYMARYSVLRRARLLGTLWASSGRYAIAPASAYVSARPNDAEPIERFRLMQLIDYWFPRVKTGPVTDDELEYEVSRYRMRRPAMSTRVGLTDTQRRLLG